MKLLLYTGSSWLWMPSVDCPDSQCTKNHYDYKSSTTFKNLETPDGIKYGIGGVNGTVCNDVVKVEGSKESSLNFLLVNEANKLD